MDRQKEPAYRSGNSSGPVMGGINLTAYPAELIPPETRFYGAARRLVEKQAREREENSTERRVEQASSEDFLPCP